MAGSGAGGTLNSIFFIKQSSSWCDNMLQNMSQVLPLHTFTPRHFESEEGEHQPLSAAAREVARDRGAKKAAGTWQVVGVKEWELPAEPQNVFS